MSGERKVDGEVDGIGCDDWFSEGGGGHCFGQFEVAF